MKPLGPWSVKGVDDDARELARTAAAAAGLTLGAWIDRAIKKSTGLEPATPNFVPITTSRTTFSEESLARSGEIEDMEDSATPVAVESFGDEGENLEASACASLEARESAGAQGEARGVTGLATLAASESPSARGEGMNGTDLDTFGLYDPRFPTGNDETPDSAVDALERDLVDSTMHFGMHADLDERVAPDVEPAAGPIRRRSRRRSRLLRMGASRIALGAAAVFIVAGVVVYGVGFSGAGHPDPSAAATGGLVASAPAAPGETAPGDADRMETAAPSDPGVIEMLTAAAEQGDVVAQYDLATRYLDGPADARDLTRALEWLERAASQGMVAAQHRLARMYHDGTGVKADDNRAAMWHTRAASQGHPESQHALAVAYTQGRGVKPSDASAVVWLQRAARAGNAESQVLLAQRHEAGQGVERSAAKAAELYALAAAKGYDGAADKAKALAALTAAKTPAANIPAPAAKPSPPAGTPLDKAGIAEVQRLLTRLAFKPGPADGVLGERTVGEIKLYQSFAGLPDDGKATVGLLNELREMVRGMSSEAAAKR